MKMKVVEVEWIDAQSSTHSFEIEELKEMPLLHTKSCGYLIHQDKEKVILGFMIFGDDMVKMIKHHQVIPRGMVKKIKELKS